MQDGVGRTDTKKRFKQLLRWLHRQGLAHARAYGGVAGRSCFTHAEIHLGKKFTWTRDVSDCFPSITPEAIKTALLSLGFRADTSKLLSLLFTIRGRVPQGSPLSNVALNLFLWDTDQCLASVGGQSRLSFGRFCDDSVITSNNFQAGEGAVRLLEMKLREKGLQINQKKKKKNGLQRRESGQRVHSIDISSRQGTKITRDHRAEADLLCNKFVTACRSLQPSSILAAAHLRVRLVGHMHYHRQAKLSLARHIRQQIEIGDRHVQRKLSSLNIIAERNKWWSMQNGRNEPKRIAVLWEKRQLSSTGEKKLNSVLA
jgi:Reverse transcriptase (RNA-dependent DNA polymerase)